jgi:copper chaperone
MNKEVPMLRYQVDDMTCGHCVQTITQAVKDLDPGAEVAVDLAAKQVAVTSQAADELIARAIREAGYTPERPSVAPQAAKSSCCGHC